MRLLDTNPLIPAAYDVVWSVVAVIALIALVAALVSIGRSRATLTSTQTLVWALLVLLLPIVGAAAWLVAGRPRSVQSASGAPSA